MGDNADLNGWYFLEELIDNIFDFIANLVDEDIHRACSVKGDVYFNFGVMLCLLFLLNWSRLFLDRFCLNFFCFFYCFVFIGLWFRRL